MIQDNLQQLRSAIEESTLPDENKTHLLGLVNAVETEAAGLETESEAGEASGEELEETESPENQGALDRLVASLDGMEATHPKLTDLINQLALGLSKMGF